jgi:hypothetical protein
MHTQVHTTGSHGHFLWFATPRTHNTRDTGPATRHGNQPTNRTGRCQTCHGRPRKTTGCVLQCPTLAQVQRQRCQHQCHSLLQSQLLPQSRMGTRECAEGRTKRSWAPQHECCCLWVLSTKRSSAHSQSCQGIHTYCKKGGAGKKT